MHWIQTLAILADMALQAVFSGNSFWSRWWYLSLSIYNCCSDAQLDRLHSSSFTFVFSFNVSVPRCTSNSTCSDVFNVHVVWSLMCSVVCTVHALQCLICLYYYILYTTIQLCALLTVQCHCWFEECQQTTQSAGAQTALNAILRILEFFAKSIILTLTTTNFLALKLILNLCKLRCCNLTSFVSEDLFLSSFESWAHFLGVCVF